MQRGHLALAAPREAHGPKYAITGFPSVIAVGQVIMAG